MSSEQPPINGVNYPDGKASTQGAVAQDHDDGQTPLRECHYRIRTHLSLLASSLTLQSDALAEPVARAALEAAAGRVIAIARLHERLAGEPAAPATDIGDYLRAIAVDLRAMMSDRDRPLIAVAADPMIVPYDRAARLGMIVSQLVVEAMPAASLIEVAVSSGDGSATLTVAAQGGGPPRAASGADDAILAALVEQVGGTLEREADAASSIATVRILS